MRVSDQLIGYLQRAFDATEAARILEAIDRIDERDVDGQDTDRIALAIVIVMGRGIDLASVTALAQRDWRDLLVAGGLAEDNWPSKIAEHLGGRTHRPDS